MLRGRGGKALTGWISVRFPSDKTNRGRCSITLALITSTIDAILRILVVAYKLSAFCLKSLRLVLGISPLLGLVRSVEAVSR